MQTNETRRHSKGSSRSEGARSPRLGAHMSIAGGIEKALLRAEEVGCDAVQIFSKNSNQWKAKPISPAEIELFEETRRRVKIDPAMVHASYLINLASSDAQGWTKSLDAFTVEMDRAEILGFRYLVVHPGSHRSCGEQAGLTQVAEALNGVISRTPGYRVKVLLELTAGQGSCVGHRFEQMGAILEWVHQGERVGICFDTCHVFAAGYDLRTQEGYAETLDALDRAVGLDRVLAFHVNDSKKGLGCRVDRHEHIGKGAIGLTAFECLVNDPRFFDRPMVLETPKGPDLSEDRDNLSILRGLIKGTGSPN